MNRRMIDKAHKATMIDVNSVIYVDVPSTIQRHRSYHRLPSTSGYSSSGLAH